MFVYCYEKFVHFIIVIGVLGYSQFSHTSITIENADNSTETSTSAPDNVSETEKETQEIKTKNNASEAKAGVQAQEVTTNNVNKVEAETQTEIKANVEVNDTFQMPNYRLEVTGLFGFAHISNTRSPLQWNLSVDILYRIIKYDRWMSNIGLRYRTFFSHPGSGNDSSNSIYAGEFTFHQVAFLSQTLIFFEDKFKIRGFLGPVFGIGLWQSLRIDYKDNGYIKNSDPFLSWLSIQIGIKSGIMLSSHFAFTTEIGFHQLGFRKYKEKVNDDEEIKEKDGYLPLSNMYVTLGLSYFL